MSEIRWEFLSCGMVDDLTQMLHDTIMDVLSKHLPLKHRKICSTDAPWLDEPTRKMIQRRQDIYEDRGREKDWHEVKAITTQMVEDRKTKYYAKECAKLTEQGSHTTPYKVLRNIAEKERSPTWTIREVRPKLDEAAQAEKAAYFFAGISQHFPPLDMDSLPVVAKDRYVQDVRMTDVVSRLVHMRKPKSLISTDIPSRLVNSVAHTIAAPLTQIINCVRRGEQWPKLWKIEEVTVIPKGSWPTTYEDCRNISCTSIFSKLCETYLLE